MTAATLPPQVSKAPTSERAADHRPGSDTMAVFMATCPDYRLANGSIDLIAIKTAWAVFNSYNRDLGYAYPSLDQLGTALGVAPSTVQRNIKRIQQSTRAEPGRVGVDSRYHPRKEMLQQFDDWKDGKLAPKIPTRISAHYGYTPASRKRQPSAAEPVDFDRDDAVGSWLIEGAEKHYMTFARSEDSHAEKLKTAGVHHSHQLGYIFGGLTHPDLQTAGFSILLADNLNTTTGYFSASPKWFTEVLGISDTTRRRLNQKLVDSGLWNIEEDVRTGQLVYTLTDLALAQIAAYLTSRRKRQADQTPVGTRITLTGVMRNIGARVAGLHLAINERRAAEATSFIDTPPPKKDFGNTSGDVTATI